MENIINTSFRLWITTLLFLNFGLNLYFLTDGSTTWVDIILRLCLIFILTALLSIPAFLTYLLVLPPINRLRQSNKIKTAVIALVNVIVSLLYTVFYSSELQGYHAAEKAILEAIIVFSGLCIASFLALIWHYSFLQNHFFITYSNQSFMYASNENPTTPSTGSNKIFYKAIVTGILIMVMLIPMIFVANLVKERASRRAEVEKDVSSKWAAPQTVSGPYLYVPYKKQITGTDGKPFVSAGYFFILPEQLSITGNIDTEERKRSIYKVLLYKTQVSGTGSFQIQIPKDISTDEIQWNETKLCMGISDFKGIEQKIDIGFKNTQLSLLPGLPAADIDSNGLSVHVPVTVADIGTTVSFQTNIALRGSGKLHFMPLAGNSQFQLHSKWLSPSFDGNTIPASRKVDKNGFSASWSFNKANLPFSTLVTDAKNISESLAFGVSLLQPGNEYAQTERCSKYAILLIGLSFALFFIMEIMQKKPVHPVQYVLVGIALIIFYTLLLSISEITSFSLAYFIAASATVLLITVYVHSHFQQSKTAAYFTMLLSLLYGFIFILLRLEDTALLVGSIGLFIILAIIMYASRRINWYQGNIATKVAAE